jgi:hypothetical protein
MTMTDKFFVLDGHTPTPVADLDAWASKGQGIVHVGDDMVGDVRVSTVFLGINHQYFDGPPLLFETMIFGGSEDGYQTRCSTWDQAEAQHAEALALVRKSLQ